jgi:hypothetical protein
VRDRLNIDLSEGDEVIGQKVQRPARVSFWWIATGETDEMGFFASVSFGLKDTVGLAAIDRREAVFGVAFAVMSSVSK